MSSWLDSVPVSEEAYVFQADLLCEDCGRAAAAELSSKGVKDDGDGDTFPQGPYPDGGGEADSAQFCGRGRHCLSTARVAGHEIGCPLLCPLTRDGVEAVWESVKHNLVSPRKFDQAMGRLLAHLWGDYLEGKTDRVLLPSSLPSLERLVKKKYVLHHVGLADRDHLYMLGITAPGQEYHLLRASVDDEGNFDELESILIPRGLLIEDFVPYRNPAQERFGPKPPPTFNVKNHEILEKLLRQAAEDGAWG